MQPPTRTFIAIDFPDEIIKQIEKLQSLISKKKFTGKLTDPENLHLTLKFLGETPQQKLNQVKSQLEKIIFPEFEAHLSATGTFNFKNQPRIVWIKVSGKQIFQLQEEIDQALQPLFKPEQRFMSHLTIARIKYTKTPQDFIDAVKKLPLKKSSFPITEFKLKSSELKPMGPKYKTLKIYKLTPITS